MSETGGEVGAVIYHGTPMTPRAALEAVLPGRAVCVSFYRPDHVKAVEAVAPWIMLDNGAYSEWQAALKRGEEWFIREDWTPFYQWLEPRLFHPGRWAVIPDAPGAPSQLNDALLREWPFGQRGAPLWHMDGPIERLARLCERYSRVCLGWVGEFDPATKKIRPEQEAVGCDAYRRRMDEVASLFGNRWPPIHMMRGVAVARDYPFRQRRQYEPRSERVAVRFPHGRNVGRQVAGATGLRRYTGRKAA